MLHRNTQFKKALNIHSEETHLTLQKKTFYFPDECFFAIL